MAGLEHKDRKKKSKCSFVLFVRLRTLSAVFFWGFKFTTSPNTVLLNSCIFSAYHNIMWLVTRKYFPRKKKSTRKRSVKRNTKRTFDRQKQWGEKNFASVISSSFFLLEISRLNGPVPGTFLCSAAPCRWQRRRIWRDSWNCGFRVGENLTMCPRTWDGWSCWNDTLPGETVYAPCPNFVAGFLHSRK